MKLIRPDDTLFTGQVYQLISYEGNHVNVVSVAQEGVTGMVIAVEGRLVNIVSYTTKEALRVFSDNVVESSEVTSGITKVGALSCMILSNWSKL
nr:putative transcription elongation factor SPT5 homolog 1 [Tanacetum cinerariifolium]